MVVHVTYGKYGRGSTSERKRGGSYMCADRTCFVLWEEGVDLLTSWFN